MPTVSPSRIDFAHSADPGTIGCVYRRSLWKTPQRPGLFSDGLPSDLTSSGLVTLEARETNRLQRPSELAFQRRLWVIPRPLASLSV